MSRATIRLPFFSFLFIADLDFIKSKSAKQVIETRKKTITYIFIYLETDQYVIFFLNV